MKTLRGILSPNPQLKLLFSRSQENLNVHETVKWNVPFMKKRRVANRSRDNRSNSFQRSKWQETIRCSNYYAKLPAIRLNLDKFTTKTSRCVGWCYAIWLKEATRTFQLLRHILHNNLTQFGLESVNWFIEWKNWVELEDSLKISLLQWTQKKAALTTCSFLKHTEPSSP